MMTIPINIQAMNHLSLEGKTDYQEQTADIRAALYGLGRNITQEYPNLSLQPLQPRLEPMQVGLRDMLLPTTRKDNIHWQV
jgi:hypothetical protein